MLNRILPALALLCTFATNSAPLRGVNQTHWDSPGAPKGIPISGATAVRLAVDFKQSPAANLARAQAWIDQGITPIPGSWAGTCKSDAASLAAIVDTWVAQASTWTQLKSPINIANEWGPGAMIQQQVSPWAKLPNYVWRDSNITALERMRAAGYVGQIVIDAGSCGQDAMTVTRDGAAVLAADPLHNVLFDVHVYGGFHLATADAPTLSWQQDYVASFAALKASGLPIIIGEFGPGRGIGPSPTMVTPERVIADAEANGFGWLAWAWDDNNLGNCQANDAWFSMTVNCGRYTGLDTELTTFGRTIIAQLKQYNAKPAVALPVGPVYVSSPALWCQPNYACHLTLAASSASGDKVKFALSGNDTRITMTSAGVMAWWTSPVEGAYPMIVVLTDAHGNTSKTPVVLTVSWVKPA